MPDNVWKSFADTRHSITGARTAIAKTFAIAALEKTAIDLGERAKQPGSMHVLELGVPAAPDLSRR
jgi:hypothetical protein